MGAFLPRLYEGARSGAWLTPERMRLWGFGVLAASLAGLAYILLTATGLNDAQGRPLGTDFSNVYAAGTYVLDGRPDLPFSPEAQFAREQALFGAATPFYGWHYPPFFLFVAGLLALLPYKAALLAWQSVTLALYLGVILAILATARDKRVRSTAENADPSALGLLLALAYPAVFINIGHGHNGFLTAALFGGALLTLERRPWLSGVLIGLLCYKPQFGLLVPLVLAVSGRWRVFAAAAATVAALVALSTVCFGVEVWSAFFASTHFTRVVVLEAGETGWHKIQSVFSWVRLWGGPVPLAYAAQGVTILALALAVGWLWCGQAAFAVKAAALVTACFLATPYSLDYDMMVLAVAIAYFAAHGMRKGFAPWEITALALLWSVPLVARTLAQTMALPAGVIVVALFFLVVLRRGSADKTSRKAMIQTQIDVAPTSSSPPN